MQPSPSKLFECPHCGNMKPVLLYGYPNPYIYSETGENGEVTPILSSVPNGYTVQWSDFYTSLPMSMVQRCPNCGKYFFTDRSLTAPCRDDSGNMGHLNFEQAKEAWAQFNKEGLGYNSEIDGFDEPIFDTNHKEQILVELLWAWNDHFRGYEDVIEFSDADRNLFNTWVGELIELRGKEDLFKCELLRECCRFDECLQTLDTIRSSLENESQTMFADQIESHAKVGDCKIFIVDSPELLPPPVVPGPGRNKTLAPSGKLSCSFWIILVLAILLIVSWFC